MKRILFLALAMVSLNVVFAQGRSGSYRNDDRNNSRAVVVNGNRQQQDSRYGTYENKDRNRNDRSYNERGYDDRRRQEEINRVNQDYDRRIDGYRNDRSMNSRDRNYRIEQAERERQGKLKSFAGGAVVGAIAGVLLGVVLSH